MALGLILKDKSAWWNSNPSRVALASFRTKWFNMMNEENCSIAALVNGRWKREGSSNKGGIGGLVKFKDGVHLMEFAGLVIVHSTFQAELQALLQLVWLLANSQWRNERILILTDSVKLLETVKVQYLSQEWEKLKSRVSLRHINRAFNTQADSLAKQGVNLNKIWIRWA